MYVYMLLGSHENEQKGASGDHTFKPYFLAIQQPNQVSGVPGAVGASTYFPSSDELEGNVSVNSKCDHPPPPPPRATPGHLNPVRLHIVGHLTRIETRPIGHLTRRKNAGQRLHKLSECFIHSQKLLVYFA